jgi:hypothetical protein
MFVLQFDDLVGRYFFSGRRWVDCVRKTKKIVVLMSSFWGYFPFSRRYKTQAIITVL